MDISTGTVVGTVAQGATTVVGTVATTVVGMAGTMAVGATAGGNINWLASPVKATAAAITVIESQELTQYVVIVTDSKGKQQQRHTDVHDSIEQVSNMWE